MDGAIVYPGEFVVSREEMDEDGVLHQVREQISGEAWAGGTVVLSWQDAATGHWWQEIWFGDQPQFRDLGPIDQKASGNIRAFLDRGTMEGTMRAIARGRPAAKAAGLTAAAIAPATSHLAAMWRARTSEILEGAEKASAAQSKLTRRSVPQIPGSDDA